jgi:ferredoxin, 2Fe-2S
MPRVTFIQPDGTSETVDVPPGLSVMEGAVENNIRGIDANCGGACACATCHVYVDPAWFDKLAARNDIEAALIDCAIDPAPNSRLACQIKMTEALDGMVVRVPG